MASLTAYQLRPATAADGEFLYALHRESLGTAIEATWGPWDDAVQREFHRDWFRPDQVEIVLVDGEPAGMLEVRPPADGVVYLSRIELAASTRGRGIGTALIADVVDRARSVGATAVELDVLEHNPRARSLYERVGFTLVSAAPPKLRLRLKLPQG
ncbi:GNAT family N-acetyltransferase [Kribbella sp. DT2]|uniref:GNAT family N-acetyltransferase n=1 Tax=Kribbella sp. DT2 TaxID=3393427 RepID=UPI003CECFCAB